MFQRFKKRVAQGEKVRGVDETVDQFLQFMRKRPIHHMRIMYTDLLAAGIHRCANADVCAALMAIGTLLNEKEDPTTYRSPFSTDCPTNHMTPEQRWDYLFERRLRFFTALGLAMFPDG